MIVLDEKVKEFINERLFSAVRPVLFTDLVHEFGKSVDWAKSAMFSYYKGTGDNVKFHCVIVCCLSGGAVAVVQDLGRVEAMSEEITDCFIYAFNPMEGVIPFNEVHRDDFITIRNNYEVVYSEVKKERDLSPKKPVSRPSVAAAASAAAAAPVPVPAAPAGTANKDTKKKKDMGLRSTALLARMRKEREDKEQERQAELKRRREETQKRELERDPKRSKQMDELSKMFEDDDDLMDMDDEEERPVTAPVSTSTKAQQTQLDESEMEEIMDTTAEESLLEIKNRQEPEASSQVTAEAPKPEPAPEAEAEAAAEPEPETYVDEDGYIVTKRPAQQQAPPKPTPKATKPPVRSKTEPSAFKPKKKQGSIESFFKRK